MRARRSVLLLATVIACAGGDDDEGAGTSSGGGSSSDESTTAAAVDYGGTIQPIWNGACTCHLQGPSGTMTATVLTLNAEVSYANLVGVAAEQAPALLRVAPGDVEASYLWHKLSGTQLTVGGIGTPMPQVGALMPDQLQAIQDWIGQGAMP